MHLRQAKEGARVLADAPLGAGRAAALGRHGQTAALQRRVGLKKGAEKNQHWRRMIKGLITEDDD